MRNNPTFSMLISRKQITSQATNVFARLSAPAVAARAALGQNPTHFSVLVGRAGIRRPLPALLRTV